MLKNEIVLRYGNYRLSYLEYGNTHRNGGPAILYEDGELIWIKYGKFHRDDAPAIVWDNDEEWYKNGLRHRIDGPALIWDTGKEEYWINGKQYTKKKYESKIRSYCV